MSIIYLRRREVSRRTGLSKSTLYRMIRSGGFPKAIPISERCVGWIEAAIDDWCEAKAANPNPDRKVDS